jgi:hypothetical protein
MHLYKVHLPKSNFWEGDTFEEWVDQSYVKGVNKGLNRGDGDDIDEGKPLSIDEIPLEINGSYAD